MSYAFENGINISNNQKDIMVIACSGGLRLRGQAACA